MDKNRAKKKTCKKWPAVAVPYISEKAEISESQKDPHFLSNKSNIHSSPPQKRSLNTGFSPPKYYKQLNNPSVNSVQAPKPSLQRLQRELSPPKYLRARKVVEATSTPPKSRLSSPRSRRGSASKSPVALARQIFQGDGRPTEVPAWQKALYVRKRNSEMAASSNKEKKGPVTPRSQSLIEKRVKKGRHEKGELSKPRFSFSEIQLQSNYQRFLRYINDPLCHLLSYPIALTTEIPNEWRSIYEKIKNADVDLIFYICDELREHSEMYSTFIELCDSIVKDYTYLLIAQEETRNIFKNLSHRLLKNTSYPISTLLIDSLCRKYGIYLPVVLNILLEDKIQVENFSDLEKLLPLYITELKKEKKKY